MRIYTEVIFNWDDKQDKLVETSSKSFDYHGELALCARKDKTYTFWDAQGHKWELQAEISKWTKRVTQERYLKDGVVVSDWDTWLQGLNKWSNRVTKFNKWFKTQVGTTYDQHHLQDPYKKHASFAEYEKWFTGITGSAPHETDFGYNVIKLNEGADKRARYDVDPDLDEEITEEQKATIIEGADSVVKHKAKEWAEIVGVDEYDLFEDAIDIYMTELKRAGEDITTAFEEMTGESGLEAVKATYETDVENLIGEEGSYTIGIEDVGAEYETQIAEAKRIEEEGLEGTVTTREETFKSLRKETEGVVREAEAKEGAAGFASTGVGKSARDILAEEIGEEARDIDVAFGEEREVFKSGYTEAETELERTHGAGGTLLRDLAIGRNENLTKYESLRDTAAYLKDDPWKEASEKYGRMLEDLPGIIKQERTKAEARLEVLGTDIERAIADAQISIPNYDPFAADGALAGVDLPFDKGVFQIDLVEGLFADPDADAGIGGAYSQYIADPGLQLYDPDYISSWLRQFEGSRPGTPLDPEDELGTRY